MSHTLNKFLAVQANVKSCDDWSAKELQALAAMLYVLRDVKLDDVYQKSNDNRRIRGSLEDLQNDWDALNDSIESHEDQGHLHAITRDGLCHETVMWYVHHLSEDVRAVLRETGVEIPLLPTSLTRHTVNLICSNRFYACRMFRIRGTQHVRPVHGGGPLEESSSGVECLLTFCVRVYCLLFCIYLCLFYSLLAIKITI